MIKSVPQKWQALAEQKPLLRGKKTSNFSQFIRAEFDKTSVTDSAHWEPAAEKQYDFVASKWTRDLLKYKDSVESKHQAKGEALRMEKEIRQAAGNRLKRHDKQFEVPQIGDPARSLSALDIRAEKTEVPTRPISCLPFNKLTKECFPEEAKKYEALLQMANAQEHLRNRARLQGEENENNERLRQKVAKDDDTANTNVAKARAAKLATIREHTKREAERAQRAQHNQELEKAELEKFVKSTQKKVKETMQRGDKHINAHMEIIEQRKQQAAKHREHVTENWAEANKIQADKEAAIQQRIAEKERLVAERLQAIEEHRLERAIDVEVSWADASYQCQANIEAMKEDKKGKIDERAVQREEQRIEWEKEKQRQLSVLMANNAARHNRADQHIEKTLLDKEAAHKKKMAEEKARYKRVAQRLEQLEEEREQCCREAALQRAQKKAQVDANLEKAAIEATQKQIAQTEEMVKWQNSLLDTKQQATALTEKCRSAMVIEREEIERQEKLARIAEKEALTQQLKNEIRNEHDRRMKEKHHTWQQKVQQACVARENNEETLIKKVRAENRVREKKHQAAMDRYYQRLTDHKAEWSEKSVPKVYLVEKLAAEADERRAKKFEEHMQVAEQRKNAALQALEERKQRAIEFRKEKQLPDPTEVATQRLEEGNNAEQRRLAQLKQSQQDKKRELEQWMKRKEDRLKQWENNNSTIYNQKEQQRLQQKRMEQQREAKQQENVQKQTAERNEHFTQKSLKELHNHELARTRAKQNEEDWTNSITKGKGQQQRAERWFMRALDKTN